MITNLRLKNYKAFSDVSIPIRPLTFLVGANNTGKSSIIQALLLLRQTAEETPDTFKYPLKNYGKIVNLGDFENIWRQKNLEEPLSIEITIKSEDLLGKINQLCRDFVLLFRRFITRYTVDELYSPEKYPFKKVENFENDFKEFTRLIKENEHEITLFKDYIFMFTDVSSDNIDISDKSIILTAARFLFELKKIGKKREFIFKYSFICNDKNDYNIETTSFGLYCDDKCLIETSIDKNSVKHTKSDLLSSDDLNYERSLIHEYFSNKNPIFYCYQVPPKLKKTSSVLTLYALKFLELALNELRHSFVEGKVNHVSPLRARPKRFYMLDKTNSRFFIDTLDGDEIAEVLKDNKQIINDVNDWLKEKFNINVTVIKLKEVIHSLILNTGGFELNISDMGFGFSQVLPIVIQCFLSPKDSLTMIEQPEIHLHPKMQADLGDLFLRIVGPSNRNKSFIIETHSEYLLKRIRRRISEGSKLNSDQISICLFENSGMNSGSKVNIAQMEQKGYFEWPKDFLDEELINDITLFLANQ